MILMYNKNMSCEKCIDIHTAQSTGLSGKACECDCHGLAWTYPIVTYSDGTAITGTISSTFDVDSNCCHDGVCETLNLNK